MPEETEAHVPAETRSILEKRARILARRPVEASVEDDVQSLVTLPFGKETYGVDITLVQEVQPLKKQNWSPVPCTPDFILGAVNIRGRVYSVMDISRFLGLPLRSLSGNEQILLVRGGTQGNGEELELCILADDVPEIVAVSLTELQAPPATLSNTAQKFVRGVTQEMLIVLALERILSEPGIIVQEQV